jgi:ATP synthase protein I
MPDPGDPFRRADPRGRTRQELERIRRREPGGRFWQSLAMVGSVGWPIVLLATGGALLGRYLDGRWQTGIRFTLVLLAVGTVAGCYAAWRVVRGDRS